MAALEKSRFARLILLTAATVIVIAGLRAAASLLVPFLMSVFLAIVVAPPYVGLQRRGVRPTLALSIVVVALVALSAVTVTAVGKSLAGLASDLPGYQEALRAEVVKLATWLEGKGVAAPERIMLDVLDPQAAVRLVGNTVSTLSNLIGQTFIILLLVVFILLEASLLPARLRALPGVDDAAWRRLESVVDNVRRYVGLKTVTSVLTGVLIYLLLLAAGVPNALFLGLLAFVLNYVPNVGSLIAAAPGILLALIHRGPYGAFAVTVGYLAINLVVSNLLEPRLMGRGLALSPMIVVFTTILWAWILGPVGMLLAVPLTMVVKVALSSRR